MSSAAQPPPPDYFTATATSPQGPGYPPSTAPQGYPPAPQPGGYPQAAYPAAYPTPPGTDGGMYQGYQQYPVNQGYVNQGSAYPPPDPNVAYKPTGAPAPAAWSPSAATTADTAEAQPMNNDGSGSWNAEDPFNGDSFSDKAVRRSFIRKVMSILMVQLLVTVGAICFFIFHLPTRNWIRYGSGRYIYYVAYAVFIITYITLVCCPGVRRKSPGNYICLGVFTLAFSYMAGTLSAFHDTTIVLIAMGITAAVCLSIMAFACQTKIDFTLCHGLLFAAIMTLFFFGWAVLIVSLVVGTSYILNAVYAGLGALVFSLFLAYDTQMLMGGRKYQLSPEEYVFGALQLYLDIVYIFIFIMTLAGSSKG